MDNVVKEVIHCKSWSNCYSTLHDKNVLRQVCEFLFIITNSSPHIVWCKFPYT